MNGENTFGVSGESQCQLLQRNVPTSKEQRTPQALPGRVVCTMTAVEPENGYTFNKKLTGNQLFSEISRDGSECGCSQGKR